MDIVMNSVQRSKLQIKARRADHQPPPTVIKAHDQEDGDVARSCQVDSNQEEDYNDILMNAIERRKLQIRARRAFHGADHQAPPPPVHNPASLPPATPAHRAGTKRQPTGPPPGFSGVGQPPQKRFQAVAPPRQHQAAPALAQYQGQPPQMQYEAAPAHAQQPRALPEQACPAQKQVPRQYATAPAAPYAHHARDAAARTPQVSTGTKPPLQPRPAAKPAACNNPFIVCRVCGVRFMTAFNLKQHEQGRKHRNKVADAAGEINVRCEVCDVLLLSKINVQQHFSGKKHLYRVFSSGASGNAGNPAT